MDSFASSDIPHLQELRGLLKNTNDYLFYDPNDIATRYFYRRAVERLVDQLTQRGYVHESDVRCTEENNSPSLVDQKDLVMSVRVRMNSTYTLTMSRLNGFSIKTFFMDNERDQLLFKLFFG